MLAAIGVAYMVLTSSQRDRVVLNLPPRRRQSSTFLVRLVGERQHAKGERMANNNDEKEALDEFLRKELAGVDLEGGALRVDRRFHRAHDERSRARRGLDIPR